MAKPKGVLVDLGGVVYQGGAVLPGSGEAILRLKRAGIPTRFLTNTTSQPLGAIRAKLEGLGIPVEPHEIFTPSQAARSHIVREGLDPHFLVRPSLMQDFSDLPAGSRPAVIVADAREGFSYDSLNEAFRRIMAGAAFIALAGNRYFRDDDGNLSLDVGAFVAALEFASGREATVLGKPSPDFFHLAVDDMKLEPKDVVMIGDDAEFDVAAAIKSGLSGYLVRTGKWQPGCSEGLDVQPTAEFDDLLQAAESLTGS
ncbi:TIGR01458 family HAD-type hydrolase [Nitratireductor sp. XY-223]|uniref:TIGR01458 family HAD-type hydrolase n=1 Tax=Nitratireductor sp. XY-223 TaxID=2561926 RepID=UPI0010AA21A6|nr:TIGR01458 family HAD-type hydrolase [Nitratireductor sp. XY-223]